MLAASRSKESAQVVFVRYANQTSWSYKTSFIIAFWVVYVRVLGHGCANSRFGGKADAISKLSDNKSLVILTEMIADLVQIESTQFRLPYSSSHVLDYHHWPRHSHPNCPGMTSMPSPNPRFPFSKSSTKTQCIVRAAVPSSPFELLTFMALTSRALRLLDV